LFELIKREGKLKNKKQTLGSVLSSFIYYIIYLFIALLVHL